MHGGKTVSLFFLYFFKPKWGCILTTCTPLKLPLWGQNPVIGSGIFLCIAIARNSAQKTRVSAVVKVPCSAHSSSLQCSWDLDWNALKPQQCFLPITSELWLCPSCPAAQVALGHDLAWFVSLRSSSPNTKSAGTSAYMRKEPVFQRRFAPILRPTDPARLVVVPLTLAQRHLQVTWALYSTPSNSLNASVHLSRPLEYFAGLKNVPNAQVFLSTDVQFSV